MNKSQFKQAIDDQSNRKTPFAPRISRFPYFIDLKLDPHRVLNDLSVAIVGVGSIGFSVGELIGMMQVRNLYFVDPGKLKEESFLTHRIIPEKSMLGKSKSRLAAEICKKISPTTDCFYFDGTVEELEMSSLMDIDMVILCTDNLKAEKNVSQRCIHLNRPLIQCAVYGEAMVAQVRFCANKNPVGPCLCCAYGKQERDQLSMQTYYSCLGPAGYENKLNDNVVPTMSTGFLCSLAADLGVSTLIRYVLELGVDSRDSLVEFYGYKNSMRVTPLRRSENCVCEHIPWTIIRQSNPLSEMRVCDLVSIAQERFVGRETQSPVFKMGDLVFVELGICAEGHKQQIRCFQSGKQPLGNCKQCNRPLKPHPFFTHRNVSNTLLDGLQERTLKQLGVKCIDSVLVNYDGSKFLILENQN